MTIASFCAPGDAQLFYREDVFVPPWEMSEHVVLAHGFPRNSNLWFQWVPQLAEEFHVVRPDLRGLGMSRVPAHTFENSVDSLVLDAVALLDHLKVSSVIWIGEATGAVVGLHLAARLPERIRCLVVMTLPLRVRGQRLSEHFHDLHPGEAILGDEGIHFMLSRGMRAWANASARNRPWLQEAPRGYVEWYTEQIATNDPLLAAAFYRPMPQVDMTDLIGELQVPTLYIDGTHDSMLRPEDIELLERHLMVEIMSVDGPGIDIGYARPRECARLAKDFIRRAPLKASA